MRDLPKPDIGETLAWIYDAICNASEAGAERYPDVESYADRVEYWSELDQEWKEIVIRTSRRERPKSRIEAQ
jgi:hypothetical protein